MRVRVAVAAVAAVAAAIAFVACARRPRLEWPARGPEPYWDPAGPFAERVADLVARMTLDEKIGQLVTDAPAIPRLGIPAYHWWSEALHGVARNGTATVFPQAIGLAATFDPNLVHRVAEAISDEARAKYHKAADRGATGRYEGLTFFSPNLNIFRDPRWGRGQETYGEDPFLTGRLGVAFIRGLQGEDRGRTLKAAATAKHFVAHSGPEALRHGFDARVSAHDLADTYLPQFEAAVREGKVASVMPAYNRVNGVPCAASPALLQRTLRDEWRFGGYVVSDCGAITDMVGAHHAAATAEQAAALALAAGTDLSCGSEFLALGRARAQGLVTDAMIDRAVTRLFMVRFRLGMFDPPALGAGPWARVPTSAIGSAEHRALALEAARASIVLLENRGGALPLQPGLRRLAVVGPTADDAEVLLGNYHGEPFHAVTLLDGIRARARARSVEVDYARGAPLTGRGVSSAQLEEARAAVRRSDAVVAILGLSARFEGEEGESGANPGGDRTDLGLPPGQQRLLEALVSMGKPVVLVLTSGGALSVPWAAAHVPAIVQAWYPGEEGGTALANVLFGDINPSGRLPVTIYQSAADLPRFEDYSMQGRTYRYLERPALYPFGHGLSYTTFEYTELDIPDRWPYLHQLPMKYSDRAPEPDPIEAGRSFEVSVRVANTGGRAGDEVVQLYFTRPDLPVYAPHLWLAGFQRVRLAPGQHQVVKFAVEPEALSIVDEQGRRVLLAGEWNVAVGGGQPRADGTYLDDAHGAVLRFTVSVPGAPVSVPRADAGAAPGP